VRDEHHSIVDAEKDEPKGHEETGRGEERRGEEIADPACRRHHLSLYMYNIV
jgi:hypothetical protein